MKKILGITILICITSSFAFIGCKTNEKNIDQSNAKVAEQKASTTSNFESTQIALKYQLIKNTYKTKNITVNYPQITNLGNDSKQKVLNEIIKNDALDGYTEGVDDNLTLEIDYNIPLETSNFLSIQYYGLSTVKGAAYPTNQFYTTNIDIKNGKKLKLADIIKIDDNFVKSFKKGSYIALEPGNSELKAAVNDYVSTINNQDLIKYFKLADSRKIEENPAATYSYLTNDSIVISINVPHVLGDHAEYKIDSADILNNIKK
jgi:hypothetical protein